ncbi:MAG: alpha/beta fold hydrolase [Solirubrobacterales bacterium]
MTPRFTPSHRGGSGSPMVLLHGFTDTWRSWELVLPELEKHHDVLALTLPGHAGGPPIEGQVAEELFTGAVEAAMDDAGFERAHIVGNSFGGYLALHMATLDRAETVTALAPAGGWALDDKSSELVLDYFTTARELVLQAAPHAEAIAASPEGRRRATEFITVKYEHIPPELIAHQIVGAARCESTLPMVEYAREHGWQLDAEKITCPVRVIWGTEDRMLRYPRTARRFREDWVPNADWIEMPGVGHCPQLDVPAETAQLILGFSRT